MSDRFDELELPENFFTRYWQREPLLLPNALPHFCPDLSPDELAGLACLEDTESRIVIERACAIPWEVRHGPFAAQDFAALPPSHWTLLVQAVDHWDEQAAALRHAVPALESWRFDDVMVSYAVDGGSVGPHVDHYDVFLLQASGRRRWCLGGAVPHDAPRLLNTEMDILRDFDVRQEWTLAEGDALYLPPGWAHWGIAEGECMTYSIGFRAPASAEILEGFAAFLGEKLPPSERYRDPPLETSRAVRRGEIRDETLSVLEQMINRSADPSDLAQWFGRYASEPKYPPAGPELDAAAARSALAQASGCAARSSARFHFIERPDGIGLFADGSHYACDAATLPLVLKLCRGERFDPAHYPAQRGLLVQLLRCGSIVAD